MTFMRARYKACILSLLVPLGLGAQDIGLLRTTSHGEGASGTASMYGGFEEGGYKPAANYEKRFYYEKV